jgi:hypothetical protein
MNENDQNIKKIINIEWYKKSWFDDNNNFDSAKYKAYNKHKKLFSALSKLKYGIVLSSNILHLKKVIGGVMINGQKAKIKSIELDINSIKSKNLSDQLKYVENLFNID